MRRALLLFSIVLGISTLSLVSPLADVRDGHVARGTPYETPYKVLGGSSPGPTVLIVGGIHGNEPAGSRAAEQIYGWSLAKGRVVIVPRANELALRAGKRRTPDLHRDISDLNRNFPSPVGMTKEPLSTGLWKLCEEVQPDWLLDLHEGFDFTQINPESVGSSVIATPPSMDMAKKMIAAVNSEIELPKRRFVSKKYPVRGSLARAAWERLGVASMILETTTRDQSLALRTRQHRILVHTFLSELGMIEHGPHEVDPRMTRPKLRVALWGGEGSEKVLEQRRAIQEWGFVREISKLGIESGELEHFDLVVFGPGRGSRQGRALGETGRKAVRDFVKSGGGYVGIAAGAYLATVEFDWSLGILDAKMVDRKNWRRGTGSLIARSKQSEKEFECLFRNGPIIQPGLRAELEDYRVLATWRDGLGETSAPGAGDVKGSPAVVESKFGKGRVIWLGAVPKLNDGSWHRLAAPDRWTKKAEDVAKSDEQSP